MRLGLWQIDGFKADWAKAIVANAPFASIEDLARRAALPHRALGLLAAADAPALGQEPAADLPAMPLSEHVAADYRATRLSLKDHPMTFLRDLFRREGALSSADLANLKDGRRASVAGVVLVRQRPAKGNAISVTVELRHGRGRVRDRQRAPLGARLRGEPARGDGVAADGAPRRRPAVGGGRDPLMTARVDDRTDELRRSEDTSPEPRPGRDDPGHAATGAMRQGIRPARDLPVGSTVTKSHDPRSPPTRGHSPQHHGHPRDVRILPRSRDFH